MSVISAQDKRLLLLAAPMILANITTPILGMVDTAVLGHLPSVEALAGASIGALVITQIYWVCGFLRMSITGLSAQQKGAKQPSELDYAKPLLQGALLAVVLGLLIITVHPWVVQATQSVAQTTGLTDQFVADYISIRAFGAPAALLNLVVIGWLIGQQYTRQVLILQVAGNVLNIVLSITFVWLLSWGVSGVAAATVVAECFMAVAGFFWATRGLSLKTAQRGWFAKSAMVRVFSLNAAMFVRNLMLQLCLAFITFQGARLGAQTAAVNAILMQFFVLISLGLDGIAYAVEALVGEAKGQRNSARIAQYTQRGLVWSSVFAVAYSTFFWAAADFIVSLLTNKPELQAATSPFLVLMVALPLIAHWCFLFDGVFVGLSQAKAMRNTMVLSALGVFFPIWWLTAEYQNWALWLAFLAFLGARGLSLGWLYFNRQQRDHLFD
ncbi:MATE family efflux transporter [Alteromonas sp. ASW11-36]|uniref:MATE family efflux transporter n=1 Tax=Alteromonas arenosi TaxID=3055817 RepID=A0ABT7T0Y8_9ALTE|nr:MATE family efflux transporter [Alteromonas sp. ASW11-36]MDM7862050.1 MATE family efflux transporter [Alteromonas sp. ASW11-36]